ncbi:MAG: phosphoribosylamine--glycine ligase [Chthoniobacterales bacterium]|nr:phosphoribosylamine--glycine ligase [Chthoniobacterales bacterium]
MKVLVVGSGGREHALVWKLQQSSAVDRIYCAPGNAGTSALGENVPIPAHDITALAKFARQNAVGLTVVGPDDSLAAGIADFFAAEDLRIFGPTRAAARLESSKIFAKQLMQHRSIPTARAGTFSSSEEALRFCETLRFPAVIKADGLALGKGVIIANNRAEAAAAIDSMMNRRLFGGAGANVVIEQFLSGWECSLHLLVSGANYHMLATARDHKRAQDGDRGPNTGGMGAVSPATDWTPELQRRFENDVMRPLLAGLREQDLTFRGLLFPGMMVTAEGPQVLEFNCRFGDPETQAILPRLKSDLLEILDATIDGTLERVRIEWDTRAAVTVVMASGGYPGAYETGKPITGLDEVAVKDGVQVFHAGTRWENGRIVTAGGRVLAVTALGDGVTEARDRAYAAVARIRFEGCHYRRDIAASAVSVNLANS